ncbi:hypothetical protein CERSUDRAFT_100509 [Gelatoporia subvermispora B]|uniref:DNA2/NAM7 helicase helicase domain-containing protein n=1 Tax=Ceriporiopsis subvermispora (strain B) TaxID=914234 RepID=M2QGZ8_CERS8|nr:hypothetical protein CERSUDRAFT_100509 [Gelatoporia subvermispora B]
MSLMQEERWIVQNMLGEAHPKIRVRYRLESALTDELVNTVRGDLTGVTPVPVGIAPAFTSSGKLTAIAIATCVEVLVVQFHAKAKANDALVRVGRELLRREILCHPDVAIFAFDLHDLATSLFHDHRLYLTNGVDIQSARPGGDRDRLSFVKFAVGDRVRVEEENVEDFLATGRSWEPSNKCTNWMACQAWMAVYLARISDMEAHFDKVPRVNTENMGDASLTMISQTHYNDRRLAGKKPTSVVNEFDSAMMHKKKAQVKASRFQSRFRKDEQIAMTVKDAHSGAEYTLRGRTADVSGRSASIKAETMLDDKTITAFTTVGAGRPTNLESQKGASILHALQGRVKLSDNPFIRYIWHPSADFTWPEAWPTSSDTPITSQRPLNDSQLAAVEHMLTMSDDHRITMIQGPPGTGKTTVIAAYVMSAIASGLGGIWLIAQSNVAVKNIAEKLADVGFLNWKLLVSRDFHEDW